MKIFISYGHNDHTQVVDLLYDVLREEGHEPWKDDRYEDESGALAGRYFTEDIYRAIDESDFVIAFVTAQTQHKPYCRDERMRAYNKKGTHFIQIRMDYADIKLGNAQSYIDLSDVVDSHGQINRPLFDKRLQALFAAFRDPDSFAFGGFSIWSKFETHLKVPGAWKYDEFIASFDEDDFTGREWLLKKCKDWVMDDSIPCRLFVILGEAGTGKTAFIRRLAQDQELVRSVHVCVYDRPSTRTARETLKDLAYVLAKNNRSYLDYLKDKPLEQLPNMFADGLFEYLFIEPLKTETQKYLLVIDGLDEMEKDAGFDTLMQLFRQNAEKINPNISFLVTGRPDPHVTHMLNTFSQGRKPKDVRLDKASGKEDLEQYIRNKLEQLGCFTPRLAAQLLDACDGNFEYLSLLFLEAKKEGLQVIEGMKLPRGLNARYAQYLDRRMEISKCSQLSWTQQQLLSVLCAAYEPLPASVLCAVTGLHKLQLSRELELFGSLIRRTESANKDPQICLFTKSFRDFLLEGSFEEYAADHQLGTQLLATYVTDRCKTEDALKQYPYLEKYGFVHLLHHADEAPEAVTAYCKSLADTGADINRWIANALQLGGEATVRSYWKVSDDIGKYSTIVSYLNGRRSADALAEIIKLLENDGYTAAALSLKADLLLWNPTPALRLEAEGYYKKALEIDEQKHQANPTYQTRRRLSIRYNRLGDLEMEKHTPEAYALAEQWYRKALEMDEGNHQANPTYETRRGLSIRYNRLGDLQRQKQTPEGYAQAEQWYRKALEMVERNHQANPTYESRRDLSIDYHRLGDLQRQKQTPEGYALAEQWYRKALEMVEQNHHCNPTYESRRDLSVYYNRLGDLEMEKHTPEGYIQAEQLYRKALEMVELNYHANPTYESRRDLSISYNRLGDLEMEKQTPEGYAQAEQWYLKMLEMDEQNYRSNPGIESRNDLSITYGGLADIARRKGTPEGQAEAEQWLEKRRKLLAQ